MATSSAAGDGAAEKKFSSLYNRLKLVEIATGPNNASSLLWPCLEFETSSDITKDVRNAINLSGREDMELVLSIIRRMSSDQGTKGPVALLLGKTVPKQNRCVWFQGELLSFMDNFMISMQSSEDVAELKDAMEATESIIRAAMPANDSTAAVEQSDAPVALDDPPSNKAAAVENPPDQGNAVEGKSTALDTSFSKDEEATVPQKSSIGSLSTFDEAIAPKESSIKYVQDAVQPRKTGASSSKEEDVILPKDAVQTRNTRASSSKEDEVIAPKEPFIKSQQEVVPLATKARASLSRKRPKTAKAARVSMDAALTAEETPPSEQDSPIADSSTTSSTQTRRSKHSSGSKRKSPPTVALSAKKQVAPSTQSKKAKTIVSSEDVIASFEEVRKRLKKGGYVFRDGVYCRPGMDPTNNKEAQVGEGYFEDQQSFRKHLCAYGVDGDRDKWTEEDESLIRTWVRYTVVKSINGEGDIPEIPENEKWDGSKAINSLLKKLGFRIKTGLEDVVVLPGVSKGQEIVDVNCFRNSQAGIWSHLARSGLPDSCYVAGVSDRDMQKLELYVSSNAEIETFGKFQGPDNATSPGISSSQSNVSGDGRSTRSLRKRSGDDNATTITAEYVGASMQKNVKQQPSTGKDKKKKRQSAKATTASSTKQSTKRQVSIPAISPVSQSPVGRQLFFSLSPKMEAETNPLPEIEGTAEEKLTASLDALKMINQAESNSFYRSGTHFASNLKTILKFLCASIESKGGHGGKQGEPAALYVCGVPGIGKTSGVKWCCTKAIEETTNNSDYEGPTPTVVHINAGHMSSASKPEGTLLKELARALGMKAPEIQKKTNILKHIKAKHMMLVVVDEIDLLVSGSSQALEGRRPGTEGVIQTLLDYAQDETMPIALIGISNSASNNKYHRLNEIGKFKDTVTFQSYSKDDLIGIVQARIGSKIVAPSALEFIAKKVEQNTGDARSALEMTVKAIERRLSAVRDGCSMPADQNASLVTMADVMPAVKKSNTKIAETIEGLPAMGKAILCVLTTLARAGSKATTLGKLKRFASDAMSESQQEEVLTLDDFKALIETLTDTGLLSIGGSNMGMGMGNLQMMPISLGLQLEDVEVAIANGLGKERFYKNLCEFTKNNTDRL